MMNERQTLFPASQPGFNYALTDEPILLNGMKVIFDQQVPVYPVTLERKGQESRLERDQSPTDVPGDEVLLPFARLIHDLTNFEVQVADPQHSQVMTIEQVRVELPIELAVGVDEDGHVQLKGGPPTQRTETTFLPVFHRMGLRLVKDESKHRQPSLDDGSVS